MPQPALQDPRTLGGRLELVPVGDLRPDPHNPRIHKPAQIRAIAKSIDAFGFNAPILATSSNQVVAGHGRLEAAKLLGLPKVPVIRLDHLTADQAKAYRLADNKLTDRSNWDDTRVATILKELSGLVLSFDIDATGFEMPEVDLRIQSLDPPELTDDEDDADVTDEIAISQPGDLWLLDHHRLYCGSALEASAYNALLGEERASAVFTDPPYNVKIDGHVMEYGKFLFAPFGRAMVSKADLNVRQNTAWRAYSTIVMVLYLPFGLILAAVSVVQVALLFLSIVGIPVALVVAKSLGTMFNPVNKKCVPIAVAEELDRRAAGVAIAKHLGT